MNKERIKIPYGKKRILLKIKERNLSFISDIVNITSVKNEYKEIKNAIANPIEAPDIKSLIDPNDKIVLIGDDLTRPTPCNIIMEIILKELKKCGVKKDNVKIVIALGTHRPLTISEIYKKYGSIANKIRIINHEFKNKRKLTYLGSTSQGTPIWINNEVLNSDVKIGIGTIMPHNLSGWSAGAKIIQPGVSGEETTEATHLISAKYDPKELLGNVENPMRKEMEEVAKNVGLDMILNVILNKKGKIVKAFSGDFIKAHREGVKNAEKIYCQKIPKEVDVIIASSYPMDLDYWIASKAIVSSYLAIKKGGTIILVTPCYEGISAGNVHTEAFRKFGKLSYKEIEEKFKEGEIKDGVAASIMMVLAKIKEKAKISIFSECLTEEMCNWLGVNKIYNIEKALEEAYKEYGKDLEIGILKNSEVILKKK
ncbi:MAG: nickel-dependent lactate racemase [Thermoplasmata archaeon]